MRTNDDTPKQPGAQPEQQRQRQQQQQQQQQQHDDEPLAPAALLFGTAKLRSYRPIIATPRVPLIYILLLLWEGVSIRVVARNVLGVVGKIVVCGTDLLLLLVVVAYLYCFVLMGLVYQ
jgi:hypothetical protein